MGQFSVTFPIAAGSVLSDIQHSMISKGNCYDNAMVEIFFKVIKLELLWSVGFE